MSEEPLLLITPNAEAMALLDRLLSEAPNDPTVEVAYEAMIPLRITRADLDRVRYGNGDLAQVGFFVMPDGSAEAVPFTKPDTSRSPFED